MVKEFSLPYYVPIPGGRIVGFIPFPKVLSACPQFELGSQCPLPTIVTITLVLPYRYLPRLAKLSLKSIGYSENQNH